MVKLLHKDKTHAIIGAAMEVYNQLGTGFLEAVYQEALAIEFGLRGMPFVEQQQIDISYKGRTLHQRYIPDYVMYDLIIVEIKALKQIGPNEEAQLLNYLKATRLKVGLLINFGAADGLQWERRVF